ncbi:MAG: hypothetical protein ACI9WU_002497, partial [Myxococcota bacterium]
NIDTTSCRPVSEPWVEGTPLRLPCEKTREDCDGVDNDADGITDPKCLTPCEADGDCTFGGLMPDADCDDHAAGGPKCSFIDGTPSIPAMIECRGVLCPPQLKCVAGDCVSPGAGLPGDPCVSGRDCPLQSGCIPVDRGDFDTGTCHHLCQDLACPADHVCLGITSGTVFHAVCYSLLLCDQGKASCTEQATACEADSGCVARFVSEVHQGGEIPTDEGILGGPESEALAKTLVGCVKTACPEKFTR